jgi:hypothetical protein
VLLRSTSLLMFTSFVDTINDSPDCARSSLEQDLSVACLLMLASSVDTISDSPDGAGSTIEGEFY